MLHVGSGKVERGRDATNGSLICLPMVASLRPKNVHHYKEKRQELPLNLAHVQGGIDRGIEHVVLDAALADHGAVRCGLVRVEHPQEEVRQRNPREEENAENHRRALRGSVRVMRCVCMCAVVRACVRWDSEVQTSTCCGRAIFFHFLILVYIVDRQSKHAHTRHMCMGEPMCIWPVQLLLKPARNRLLAHFSAYGRAEELRQHTKQKKKGMSSLGTGRVGCFVLCGRGNKKC